jgi:hypothetical protein
MKMKQKKIRKIGIASALGLVVLVMLGLYGASNYMLHGIPWMRLFPSRS